MRNRVPRPATVLDLTPVPRRYRFDGWTIVGGALPRRHQRYGPRPLRRASEGG